MGETDPEGSRKVVDPHSVADIHATLLTALGLDPTTENMTSAGRPIQLSEGQAIRALLADIS